MEDSKNSGFAFGRENYKWLIISVVVLLLGFALMSGGGSDDPKIFSEAIFCPVRITVAPLLVMCGYVLGIFAIMKKA